ncbi:MAG: hypothetical protein AAF805_02055 [Planctomycetota bacterium]
MTDLFIEDTVRPITKLEGRAMKVARGAAGSHMVHEAAEASRLAEEFATIRRRLSAALDRLQSIEGRLPVGALR